MLKELTPSQAEAKLCWQETSRELHGALKSGDEKMIADAICQLHYISRYIHADLWKAVNNMKDEKSYVRAARKLIHLENAPNEKSTGITY